MAGKSLEQRLTALREKQDSIATKIKRIETEHHRQLRKEKQERARIIGMAMLRRVEDGACSNDELQELVSPFVINGKERRLLGLIISSEKAEKPETARPITRSQPVKSARKSPMDLVSEENRTSALAAKDKWAQDKRLPETVDDNILMNEFNL